MVADVLVMKGAKASTAMILTYLTEITQSPHIKG